MTKSFIISICFSILIIFTTICCQFKISTLSYNYAISRLNGKWSSSCEVSIEDFDESICPEFESYEVIEIDESKGIGKIITIIDSLKQQELNIKIFKEKRKRKSRLFITYFLPNQRTLKGEIVKLTNKSFIIKFEEQKYYSIRKRK